jgi:3-oxoacyl-[acyl-carrier protein] reductase
MVTAASEGLGYACALRLAEAGCRIAICGRRANVLDAARAAIQRRAGGEVCALPADLTQPDQIDAFVRHATARFERVDILVVNTGHIPYGGLHDLHERDWYAAFELILMSAVRLTRLVTPLMRGQGSGDIVFITSAVVKEPAPRLLLSNVMRAGVSALAKSLSRELAPDNIRVNNVAPGYFDTGRVRRRIDEVAQRDGVPRAAATRTVAGDVPAGRIGAPEELAELVCFLATRRAGFVTGATVPIDGGSGHGLF